MITQDGPSESFPRIFLLELEGKSLCILSDKELSECWTVHSMSASWKSWLERKCWYAGWNRERENTLMVSKPVTQVFLDPMFIPAWSDEAANWTLGCSWEKRWENWSSRSQIPKGQKREFWYYSEDKGKTLKQVLNGGETCDLCF